MPRFKPAKRDGAAPAPTAAAGAGPTPARFDRFAAEFAADLARDVPAWSAEVVPFPDGPPPWLRAAMRAARAKAAPGQAPVVVVMGPGSGRRPGEVFVVRDWGRAVLADRPADLAALRAGAARLTEEP